LKQINPSFSTHEVSHIAFKMNQHHFPQTSTIAFNKAFLLSVRRAPELRGIWFSLSDAARSESVSPNVTKSMRRPAQSSVFDKRFRSILIISLMPA
jgi:hypothetical protein